MGKQERMQEIDDCLDSVFQNLQLVDLDGAMGDMLGLKEQMFEGIKNIQMNLNQFQNLADADELHSDDIASISCYLQKSNDASQTTPQTREDPLKNYYTNNDYGQGISQYDEYA